MAGALEGDMFIGPNAEEHRGLLSLKYPMEHGYVNDWSDMERVWQYVYSKEQLNTFAEEVTSMIQSHRVKSIFGLRPKQLNSYNSHD